MNEALSKQLELYLVSKQKPKKKRSIVDTGFDVGILDKDFECEKLCNILPDLNKKDKYKELNDYLKEKEEDFISCLYKKIDEKGMADSEVYNKAGIDRRLFSKIRHADYKPDRDTVLALCIALELEIDDIEVLLKKTCHSLSKSRTKDLIIRFFIEEQHNYSFFDINEALMNYGQKPINKF